MRAVLAAPTIAVLFTVAACSSGDGHVTATKASARAGGAGTTEAAFAVAANQPFVRRCDTNVYGRLDPHGWRRHSIVAGPLAFWNARWYERERASTFAPVFGSKHRYQAQKLLVLVQPGADATVIVPTFERRTVALLYNPDKWNHPKGYRLEDGDAAVTFVACKEDDTLGTGGRLNEMTQFNGGFIVAGVRCVPLEVLVRGEQQPIPVTLSFGAGHCR